MSAIEQCGQTQNAAARFDTMLDTLRNDVWSAKRIESSEQSTLALSDASGQAIRWMIRDDGSVTRRVERSSEVAAWTQVASGLHFLRDERLLCLVTARGDEIPLLNLTELAKR
jgi:hypothetical protein